MHQRRNAPRTYKDTTRKKAAQKATRAATETHTKTDTPKPAPPPRPDPPTRRFCTIFDYLKFSLQTEKIMKEKFHKKIFPPLSHPTAPGVYIGEGSDPKPHRARGNATPPHAPGQHHANREQTQPGTPQPTKGGRAEPKRAKLTTRSNSGKSPTLPGKIGKGFAVNPHPARTG